MSGGIYSSSVYSHRIPSKNKTQSCCTSLLSSWKSSSTSSSSPSLIPCSSRTVLVPLPRKRISLRCNSTTGLECPGGAGQGVVDKLVGNNYRYWKLCMEAYLKMEDLWELVAGAETTEPTDILEQQKRNMKYGKALFALRTSISKEYFEHVRDAKKPKEIWETFERLFSQKNTARLQYLENELAMVTQGNASISEYFLKVKNLCSEISELDAVEDPNKDARLRRYLIRGLRMEFMPFISSVQGWVNQPSIIELENLLSNQEALVRQMSNKSLCQVDDVLYTNVQRKSLCQVDDVLYTNVQRKMNFSSNNSYGDHKQSRSEGQSGGDSQACVELKEEDANVAYEIVCVIGAAIQAILNETAVLNSRKRMLMLPMKSKNLKNPIGSNVYLP